MKKLFFAGSLLLLIAACSPSPQVVNTQWPEVTQQCKPYTRWWWMGSAVDEKNLTYNLESLSKAGIGGVEITPIYGVQGQERNDIDFLSNKWMKMLSYTQSESKRLGLQVDMNMGTGWPFGGPKVTLEDAATCSFFQSYTVQAGKQLKGKIEINDKKQKGVAYLQCLMAYPHSPSGEAIDITQKVKNGTLHWTAPKEGSCTLIALFVGKTQQKVKRASPGGEGYVLDHFSTAAVDRYFKKFDDAFKTSGVHFPNTFFCDSYEVFGADWTPDLLSQFEKRRGYKLQNYFPALLEKGATDISKRVISDYRETIGDMLLNNFTKPWVNWAHNRGITIRDQAHGSPANLIDLYAAVDIPECESFGVSDFPIPFLRKDSIKRANDGDPTSLKYASSAAHITGKKYTSSETLTWLTEHFRTSLSQCKPEIDQMFTSGVNHMFFHGTTYSPKEAAWPGWRFYASINVSPTNPFWEDAPALFQYITRSQSFLQAGTPDNDFLVYLPIYDVWNNNRNQNFMAFTIHGMKNQMPHFYDAVANIRNEGYDLDYISDQYIKSTTVEHGLLKTSGATYKALILPSVDKIPLATMQHIRDLAQAGATILFVDQYPSSIPGYFSMEQQQEQLNKLLTELPHVSSFNEVSSQAFGKGVIITGTHYKDVLAASHVVPEAFKYNFKGDYIRRKNETGYHYFFTMLQNNPIDTWVPLSVVAQSAMFFDPLTGVSGKAKIRQVKGTTEVYMQLQAGASLIVKTFTHSNVKVPEWLYYQETGKTDSLTSGWSMYFIKSQPRVQEQFKLKTLGSWTQLSNDTLKVNMGVARYEINYNCTKKAHHEYRLCLGDVRESARIYVNGVKVTTLFSVPFETNIGNYLHEGQNTIAVEVTNLPANRIANYDRLNIPWRIFKDINIVSVTYKPVRFDSWSVIPSGLMGPVEIKELKPL